MVTQEQKAGNLDNQLQTIVKVKPGSSSEKGVMFVLPEDKANLSLNEIINYSLTQEGRKNERIIGRVKAELSRHYGITVNGKVAGKDDKINDYLRNQTLDDGTPYKELEIVVASKQAGGY